MSYTHHDLLAATRKSVPGALFLALCFGPCGLLYVSAPGGFFLTVLTIGVAFVVGSATLGLGAVVVVALAWLISMPWAAIAAMHHNRRIERIITGLGGATGAGPPRPVDFTRPTA